MEKSFSSLLEAINYYDSHDSYIGLNLKNDRVTHPTDGTEYPLNTLTFILTHKFEEDSDSDDTSVLHIVELPSGEKGYFIDAAGMYSDSDY